MGYSKAESDGEINIMSTELYRLKVTIGSLKAPLVERVAELGDIHQSEYIRKLIELDIEKKQLNKSDFQKKAKKL